MRTWPDSWSRPNFGDADQDDRLAVVLESERDRSFDSVGAWSLAMAGPDGSLAVITEDSEGERQAREAIRAFVGPALVMLGAASIVDTEAQSVRVVPLKQMGSNESLLGALELLAHVRSSEPERQNQGQKPLAFLLRDFRLAVRNGDAEESKRLLQCIRTTGEVDGENIRFLGVERLAALNRWEELKSLKWFDDLARARRPRRISEALLEAVWQTDMQPKVHLGTSALLNHYQSLEIAKRLPALLRAVLVPHGDGARRLVSLSLAVEPDERRLSQILEATPDATERQYLQLLAHTLPADSAEHPPEVDTGHEEGYTRRAMDLLDESRFGEVVDLAEQHPDSLRVLALATSAVGESRDPDLAARLLHVLAVAPSMPSSSRFLRHLKIVEGLVSADCDSWIEWFERIAADTVWPEGADVLRDRAFSEPVWTLDALKRRPNAEKCATQLERALDGPNESGVQASIDLLCDLAESLCQEQGSKNLVLGVIETLVLCGRGSPEVGDALLGLAGKALAARWPDDEYSDLMDALSDHWEKSESPVNFDWALDALDTVAVAAGGGELHRLRIRFAHDVGESCRKYVNLGRIGKDLATTCQRLVAECGAHVQLPPWPEPVEDDRNGDVWAKLDGRLVGLYTLDETRHVRLREWLKERCDSVRLEWNNDHVETQALVNLAQRADWLIVDAAKSKHPATWAISRVRARDRQLFPGRGAVSSYLRVLQEALEHGVPPGPGIPE